MTVTGTPASEPSPELYDAEFRSYDDDAWYTVRMVGEDSKLIVKYLDFPDEHDSVFHAGSFTSAQEIEDFVSRFRRLSQQVQDAECSKLVKSLHVCTSHSFYGEDLRFFDAVIDEVERKEHSFQNGEEICQCSFLLVWQHGPLAGKMAMKKIENICIVQNDVGTVPEITFFVKMLMEKNIDTFHRFEGKRLPRWSIYETHPPGAKNGQACSASKQDIDIGGLSKSYMLLISNLETDLSSLKIMEFIYRHTLVLCQALVYPSSSAETYTRGAILSECEKDAKKLSSFLNNPNYIILSSRGRPLYIDQALYTCKVSKKLFHTALSMVQEESSRGSSKMMTDSELRIVKSGTKEYEVANQLLGIHNEFISHQKRLHERLAKEEKKLLEQL